MTKEPRGRHRPLSKMRSRWQSSVAFKASQLLPMRPRKKLLLLFVVQIALGALDLIAVALVGILGTLAIAITQSQTIGLNGTIGRVLRLLHLQELSPTTQVGVLAVLTGVLFVSRSLASIQLTRRALHFLGIRAAEASAGLVDRLLQRSITYLQTRSTHEFIYATTTSTNSLVVGVLGTLVIMAADAAMLVALGLMLIYVSPVTALMSAVLLGVLVMLLHRLTTERALGLGEYAAAWDVQTRELLTEAIATFRDMQVRGSQAYYAKKSREVRLKASAIVAEVAFLPNISKYVLEGAVIVGALLIAGLQFWLEDAQRAVGVLTLFLAAGARLAPAVIRLQQGATTLRYNAGQGSYALTLGIELGNGDARLPSRKPFTTRHEGFEPSIAVSDVSYSYPMSAQPAVQDLSFVAKQGQLVALVGPSGAGKSTVADLVLGVLEPQHGSVKISGMAPDDACGRWPGAVAYVPQDVWITDGSIRRNLTLGFEESDIEDDAIWRALTAARLEDVVLNLPGQLDAVVGERGARFSGGQRQRLGIARALLTEPALLVLDEATSSLDAVTEHEVTEAVRSLHGDVTVLVIAHRLATVRHADLVIYMQAGVAQAMGSFDSVRASVPDFDLQAALLGL